MAEDTGRTERVISMRDKTTPAVDSAERGHTLTEQVNLETVCTFVGNFMTSEYERESDTALKTPFANDVFALRAQKDTMATHVSEVTR